MNTIEGLKRKLRRISASLDREYDNYSCGRTLTDYMNPRTNDLKEQFREIYARLREIDPHAPEMPKNYL